MSGNKIFTLLSFASALCVLRLAAAQQQPGPLAGDKKAGFVYDKGARRNPFIPLVTSDGRLLKLDKQEVTGDLSLEGIVYDKQGISYCLVNGQVLKIGDIVGDYQLLKIEEKKAVFLKEGRAVEVELNKEE